MTDIASLDCRPARAAQLTGKPSAVTAANTLVLALGAQVALLVPSLIAYALDDRQLIGVSVWSKPLKFEMSLIVTIATLIWLLPHIDAKARGGRVIRWTALAIGLMATLEIFYIILQAARGRASHFNDSTPLETTLYSVMGIGAVTLVAGCFIIGWMLLRYGKNAAGPGLRYGGAWGLMMGAVLTLVTAGVLSSGTIAPGGHWVGGIRSDAGGLFLFGWSRTGGDLRVPHFFATHLMQALPLLGLFLDRYLPGHVRSGLLAGGAAGVLIIAATFLQATMGRPFL
jgi:hypothetical protein